MATAIRVDGDLLIVPLSERLPKVCLLCGATKSLRQREHLYAVGTNTGSAMGGVGGAVGAMAAPTLRHLDHGVAATIFIAVLGGVTAIGYLAHRMAHKVAVTLPLCERCDDRWTDGEAKRSWVLLGLALSLALGALAYGIESVPIGVGALAVFVISLGLAWVSELRSRFVPAAWTKTDAIAFRVPTQIASEVVARAEKRAEKHAARRASDDATEAAEGAAEG